MPPAAKRNPPAPPQQGGPQTYLNIQQHFSEARASLNATLVERGEEVDLCLTALLCQQHVLMVGPPGTAKSLIAESLRTWIMGAKSLTVHCCKDTTRAAAFGPVKLSSLKADKTERNLDGGAADAHILIMEEVFKSGPAVLDMFLMLMNERVYKEGLVQCKAPLRFLLGVSNEWSPEGCESALAAFFDRFLLRRAVEPIRTRDGLRRLAALPVHGAPVPNRTHKPQFNSSLTLPELDEAHRQALGLSFTKLAAECFWEVVEGLKKEGIVPGDRRLKLSVSACQAFAYLCGASAVSEEHLEVLAHCLWVDPQEQPGKAAKVVARIANPVGMLINECLAQAEDVAANTVPTEAVPKLQEIQKKLQAVREGPHEARIKAALTHTQALIKETYGKVIGT